jgi:predicted transposase YbfD/YdcC
VITVKRNQPERHAQLAKLPWRQVPVAYRTRDKGHSRTERRTVKITAVATGLAFPHAAQAIQIVRRQRPLSSKKRTAETVYAITSLTAIQALPADLAAIIRGHWLIQHRLHWVRDMNYDEDRSQVRTANGPRVMASLRNLAITIFQMTGETSIAAALRHHARRPGRPLQTIMNC